VLILNKLPLKTLDEMIAGRSYIGFKLADAPFLQAEKQEKKRRGLIERLFTLPWRPLQSHKVVTVAGPSETLYLANGVIYGHPATIARIREAQASN